jgi:hypothetical protein
MGTVAPPTFVFFFLVEPNTWQKNLVFLDKSKQYFGTDTGTILSHENNSDPWTRPEGWEFYIWISTDLFKLIWNYWKSPNKILNFRSRFLNFNKPFPSCSSAVFDAKNLFLIRVTLFGAYWCQTTLSYPVSFFCSFSIFSIFIFPFIFYARLYLHKNSSL